MITVRRSALVMHSAARMYALVADIPAYRTFLPWCEGGEIHEEGAPVEGGIHTRASIRIGFKGVRQHFTTDNIQIPDRSIRMRLVDGPFRALDGEWRFTPLAENACKVELDLAYEFANPILARLVGPVFGQIANTMVDAFIKRADELYAAGGGG
jgi:ribosome-associated toxin RatA of RatAB toxin-antitoxin module